jgi:hypothetical protein
MLSYIVIFAFTYVLENVALLYGDFSINSYSVNNDEAMKQGNEALNASLLHFSEALKASSLHRHNFYSLFNASSALLFLRESLFIASSLLLFK